ncbi:MAG: hypothetical protein C4536_14925 [Actinobacteria bacterium]|jgi:hypothetical protein|nr:MAG: hypothetical protein C4536_14925 [Actinomycetota bacterium]
MTAKRRLTIYLLFILALALALPLVGVQPAASYPPAGTGFEGWTAESIPPNAYYGYHAQMARGDSYLYLAAEAPGNGNVNFWKCSDTGTLAWAEAGNLDAWGPNAACDPYIDAEGTYVAVSWKEVMGIGKWATVVAVSPDWGTNWTKWWDYNEGWNNYEAHVDISGGKIHCAYVSDYGGRNEVYYRRFDLGLNMEHLSCVSNSSDGIAASLPCIESAGAQFANVYYQYGNSSPHPIYEAWTNNGGTNWNITPNLVPEGPSPGTDMSWPEVAVFWEGGDRRKMVVADGLNTGSSTHTIYYSRFYDNNWTEKGKQLCPQAAEHTYPQITSHGNDLLVVYRQSAGGLGNEGAAHINTESGVEGSWRHIDNLFYDQMPLDACGCIDCCSDGARFYAVECSWGSNINVHTKREDTTDPNVTINDPGTYHSTDFNLTATASDDFNRTDGFILGPYADQRYDGGIHYAEFYYKPSGSGTWIGWPAGQGGTGCADAPWSRTFPASTIAEGSYDFRVVVRDTAERVSENILTGVVVDRTAPVNVDLQISAPDGDNGWYINQPSVGPSVVAQDQVSGVKATYYKYDGAADWTVYSMPFALLEGTHDIHYYAEDNAGNTSAPQTFSYQADFTDPAGEVTTPAADDYHQRSMQVEASCSDGGSGVASLTWLVDGMPVASGPEPQAVLDIAGLVDGQHPLQAEIRDAAGRSYITPAVLFYKDVTPPGVTVVEPTGEHWLRGMATLKADIRDNLKVGRAAFYVDGVLVDERTSAPWMASWDTSTMKNGYHAIRVEAWDAAGNQAEVNASGEVTVYVGNNISETNNFAEGCTRSGFDTWLCLQNPGDEAASVTVNYYLGQGQGSASTRTYALPPHSRNTIYVNNDVGADKDVSIQVTSSRPIVSERPMYFDYQGTAAHHWQGCHTAQGAHFPRTGWYFAEGCTRSGFETWLCLQNPEGREATVKVEYMLENGASLERSYRVSAWSRGTVLVNGEVGPDRDVSMRVTSDVPIVAERPVYFLYQGMWDGGHNVMGAAQPETEWYFAEGCTRTGFNQWICLQNPNDEATAARIVYVMEDGGRIEREYGLAPRSRFTVNVNNDVARQHDVSAYISSHLPIVVERPMYFLYNSTIDEGSNAMGVCRPGSSWYLAEGCTREGFEEWICLMNPGEEAAQVELRFMLEDASQRAHAVCVPPGTRVTVRVNDVVGPGHDVSCEVMSDRPVVVERPMYSVYRGSCPSGDTLSGYTFNP